MNIAALSRWVSPTLLDLNQGRLKGYPMKLPRWNNNDDDHLKTACILVALSGFAYAPVCRDVVCVTLQMADKSQSGTLEDDEFVLFYKMLTQREDVLRIFQDYSGDGQKLTLRDLEDFLRGEQLETNDVEQRALELIKRYEPSDAGTNQNHHTAQETQLNQQTEHIQATMLSNTV